LASGEWWLNHSLKVIRRRRTGRRGKSDIHKIGFLWLRRKEYTSKVKPGIKKGAIGAFFKLQRA
jgi:hypothetical protein